MKALRSRILSIALAASLLLSSGMIAAPLSAGATGEGSDTPIYTDDSKFTVWGNPANWGYTIEQDPWKLTCFDYGYPQLRYDDPKTINLNETPCISYNVESNAAFRLELFCSANNPQEVVNVIVDSQDMTGNKGTGLVDLRTVPEVIQAADEDGNVTINTFYVEFAQKDQFVQFNTYEFVPAPKSEIKTPAFTNADKFNVWGNPAAWGYTITQDPWKMVCFDYTYPELRYDDPKEINLNETPYLAYDMESNAGFQLKLWCGGKDAVVILDSKDLTGNKGSGLIDLREVSEVMSHAGQDGKVTIKTLYLEFAQKDQYIQVNSLGYAPAPQSELDKEAAQAFDALVASLPAVDELQLTDKEAVAAVRAAYEELTGAQKLLVTKLAELEAAEKRIEDLIYNSQTEVDKRAAKAVDDKIASIGYVMLHKEALITECRDAYNALTETQKALVTKLDVLKAAEEKLAELKANPPAENTAKTETFLDKFDDGSFPKAVKTITPREDIDINQVFSLQREVNANIYKYKFGAEFDKSSGILFKQMTEVDAAVVYEFENGLKSLEFVSSYIHASIFKSAVPGVFEISWSETLDGEYTPFTASDIKYTREKIGDDYVPGDPENEAIGNQYLAYYNIENIPAQARYIKLFFKGSDPEAEYPFNYANWQAPLGYLKVEAYKKTVDIEENKTLTDAATGIRVTGDLPKGAELVVIDKSESGVKNALAAYLQNPAVKDYQNALSMVEIRIMVGGEVYTDFEKPLIVAFPVKEQVAGAAYYAMTYDMDIDKFTPIAGEAVDGYYQMETTWTGDFVLLGNDKAAEGFGPVDPGSKEESSDNGGAPDTGRAFPAAALLVLAGAAGAVLALRKRKS
ncbi:coiled-coil domain-containing protein [Anaeromassilibacillus sp. SJQ-5]